MFFPESHSGIVWAVEVWIKFQGSYSSQGRCSVFFGKILYSHAVNLHPGV